MEKAATHLEESGKVHNVRALKDAAKEIVADAPKSSTQLTLKPEDAKAFTDFANSIPKSEIYSKNDEDGKEDLRQRGLTAGRLIRTSPRLTD